MYYIKHSLDVHNKEKTNSYSLIPLYAHLNEQETLTDGGNPDSRFEDEFLIKLIVGVVKHITIDELGPVDYRGSNRFL
jgi:hypothetical protein